MHLLHAKCFLHTWKIYNQTPHTHKSNSKPFPLWSLHLNYTFWNSMLLLKKPIKCNYPENELLISWAKQPGICCHCYLKTNYSQCCTWFHSSPSGSFKTTHLSESSFYLTPSAVGSDQHTVGSVVSSEIRLWNRKWSYGQISKYMQTAAETQCPIQVWRVGKIRLSAHSHQCSFPFAVCPGFGSRKRSKEIL